MTKSIPSSVYVYQFNNGDYLSWYDVNGRYTFGATSEITQATMFEKYKDVPKWITPYLDGEIIHISLEVTSND